ncbi:hypothetical protein [Vibrio sp. WXL103]|uniref:hypothetical protein n=1 Tax=Vibrio sp. WXL103 TaxID=3450710 RepID=UPI003EC6649C
MRVLVISKIILICLGIVISPVHADDNPVSVNKSDMTQEQKAELNASCTARDGWKDARTLTSYSSRCKGSDNYLQYMRERTTGITSRWQFN